MIGAAHPLKGEIGVGVRGNGISNPFFERNSDGTDNLRRIRVHRTDKIDKVAAPIQQEDGDRVIQRCIIPKDIGPGKKVRINAPRRDTQVIQQEDTARGRESVSWERKSEARRRPRTTVVRDDLPAREVKPAPGDIREFHLVRGACVDLGDDDG